MCVWGVQCIAHTCFWSRAGGRVSACVQLHLLNTTNTVTQLVTGLGCEWCYLVISRKLRRVERSSRRLICLWHWLQKKSSASSLRKLWKQSGRGAGALERGKYGGKVGGSGERQTRMRWVKTGWKPSESKVRASVREECETKWKVTGSVFLCVYVFIRNNF